MIWEGKRKKEKVGVGGNVCKQQRKKAGLVKISANGRPNVQEARAEEEEEEEEEKHKHAHFLVLDRKEAL